MAADLITQPGYLLHRQPWKDPAEMLDCLTPGYGRIWLFRQKPRDRLPMYQRLELSFVKQGEFYRLKEWRAAEKMHWLDGDRLYIGLYLNELLVKLSHRDEANETLFGLYSSTLHLIANRSADAEALEGALRYYELQLMRELGYGIDFDRDAQGMPLQSSGQYQHLPGQGFQLTDSTGYSISGDELKSMQTNDWASPLVRRKAKAILRAEINLQLNGQSLKSRELLQRIRAKN